jgi:acyl-CoA reductase-like NAD-dependent aldehyde dehydrogenase
MIRNVIGGVLLDTALCSELFDPATGKVFATAALSRAAEVDAAYEAAVHAFKSWRRTTPAVRQQLLLDLADALAARVDDICVRRGPEHRQARRSSKSISSSSGPLTNGHPARRRPSHSTRHDRALDAA